LTAGIMEMPFAFGVISGVLGDVQRERSSRALGILRRYWFVADDAASHREGLVCFVLVVKYFTVGET